MKFYYKAAQIPEFLGLSAKQRDYVWKHCVAPFLRRPVFWLSRFLIGLSSFWFLWLLMGKGGIHSFAAALGIGCLLGCITYWHDLFWASRRRPQIAQFIRDHWQEIQAIPPAGWRYRDGIFSKQKKPGITG